MANEIKQRVIRAKDVLLNSQISLAQGCQYLYKIKKSKAEGKKGQNQNRKPELVTSQREIEKYLAGEYEYSDDEYYFMTTERPDNKMIDYLFTLIFGIKSQYGEEWSEQLRESVRERDEYKCALCRKQAKVVHHIDYDKNNNNKDNLITLCPSCHGKTNKDRSYWIKLFNIK